MSTSEPRGHNRAIRAIRKATPSPSNFTVLQNLLFFYLRNAALTAHFMKDGRASRQINPNDISTLRIVVHFGACVIDGYPHDVENVRTYLWAGWKRLKVR